MRDDFNHATQQLSLYRKEIDRLKLENENLNRENKRIQKENEEYLDELATCREHLLPLMEPYDDYEQLLSMTVSEPLSISDLCERVAEEFCSLK
ncbi:hypothetical protein P4485_16860 [Bacillus thuringiensis]|nr:hypothetical protein [Bacillus thuringiensis]